MSCSQLYAWYRPPEAVIWNDPPAGPGDSTHNTVMVRVQSSLVLNQTETRLPCSSSQARYLQPGSLPVIRVSRPWLMNLQQLNQQTTTSVLPSARDPCTGRFACMWIAIEGTVTLLVSNTCTARFAASAGTKTQKKKWYRSPANCLVLHGLYHRIQL